MSDPFDFNSDIIGASEFWQQSLHIKETFIYKIPPLATAAGHRAEDWDLANPLLTGSLKCFQCDVKFKIILYGADGIEFGECPIQVEANEEGGLLKFVEGVIDSSRYFVFRLKDKNSNRTAMIGVGFRDRDVAFDLKSVLNDYIRYVDRSAQAEENNLLDLESLKVSNDGDDNKHNNNGNKDGIGPDGEIDLLGNSNLPPSKLQLKEGEKIHVNFAGKTEKKKSISSSSGGGKLSFIPPPPPAGSTIFVKSITTVESHATTTNATENNEDEDWSDFTAFS